MPNKFGIAETEIETSMFSPPSSPVQPDLSPPSSPVQPHVSPPSSPINNPAETPRKKRRSWLVYNTNDNSDEQLSKNKLWRWRTLGIDAEVDRQYDHNVQTEEIMGEEDNPPNIIDYGEDHSGDHCGPDDSSAQGSQPFNIHEVPSSASSSSSRDSSGSSSDDCRASDSSVASGEYSDSESTSENSNVGSDSESSSSSISSSFSNESDEDSDSVLLYEGSKHSVDVAILDILTDHVENHQTRKSLDDHLKTFLKHLPKPNNMPKTTTQLLDCVERLAPAYSETAHHYCSKCFLYLENLAAPCPVCDCSKSNRFYSCSIEEQLKSYFENYNLADVIDSYRMIRQSGDGTICDIVNGSEYLRVQEPGDYNLTLMMNTDGVSLSGSSRTSMWPVMFVISEVPPHLRKKFMIVCGIWCDSRDPPMNTFMRPFVEVLEGIDEKGGLQWTHPSTLVQHQSRVYVPLICADAPARAKLQNIAGHTGKQACNTCEQKSVRIPLTEEEQQARAAGNRKIRRKRGYVFCENPAKLRTAERMKLQARAAMNLRDPRKSTVKGVKGPTALSFIPKIDISKCFYAEYMHGVCLGVVRLFLTLWLTVPGDWNISGFKADLDSYLENIAPSSDICRLPRGVSDVNYWKASELRAWLLFYSLPCLSGKLPHQYLQHWSLLVQSIYLLLQEKITEQDLNLAETMVRMFVRDISRLYRCKDCLYNVHQLIHLPLYVKRFGPLWSTSAFIFEGYNKNLLGLIHGTKNRCKELMKNVRIAHGIEILRTKLDCKRKVSKTQVNVEPLNVFKIENIPVHHHAFLVENGMGLNAKLYYRARFGRETYTSAFYSREKKRNNFTVKFKSPTAAGYGVIQYFVSSNNEVFAVILKLRIDHTNYFTHDISGIRVRNIVPVEEEPDSTVLVNVKHFLMKVIRVGNTVCLPPNCHERNL